MSKDWKVVKEGQHYMLLTTTILWVLSCLAHSQKRSCMRTSPVVLLKIATHSMLMGVLGVYKSLLQYIAVYVNLNHSIELYHYNMVALLNQNHSSIKCHKKISVLGGSNTASWESQDSFLFSCGERRLPTMNMEWQNTPLEGT